LVVCNLHFHWFYALCNMILAMIILDQWIIYLSISTGRNTVSCGS
jgi:hypothetical protein